MSRKYKNMLIFQLVSQFTILLLSINYNSDAITIKIGHRINVYIYINGDIKTCSEFD